MNFITLNRFSILACIILFAGCRSPSDSNSFVESTTADTSTTSVSTATSPTPAPSATVTSTPSNPNTCKTKVIDRGIKGSVAAVARGNFSDTANIPNASLPAFAYNDAGAVALKFMWKESTTAGIVENIEIIAGESAAGFINLAFFSNSTPIVAWTSGTAVKVAIRSSALPNAGTWNVGVIDTGTAPRAAQLSINPMDSVGLLYLTDTAVAGRARFAYCAYPCQFPSNFQTQSTTPFIDNNNIVAAQIQTGLAWCKADSTTYYPAATFGSGTTTKYGVCQNTLSNCLSSTNWSFVTASNIASTASTLHLDSNTAGDVPKVLSGSATGITPSVMGSTLCTAAPVNLTTGTVFGGANTGTQAIVLMRDPNSKFHIIANAGPSTSIVYLNSTTSNLSGAWNTAGIVETITLPNPIGPGAYLDANEGSITLSYGQNAGFFDLRYAKVQSYSVASQLAVFSNSSVDSSGNIQLTAATPNAQANTAMAKTANGRPAIAYIDFSNGAATAAKLKFALRDGSGATDSWSINIVGGPISPQFPSLAFDENNRPWISYFEASNNRFYIARGSNADGSGSWTLYAVPTLVSGAPIALPAANQTSMAMYYSNGIAQPVVIFIDNNATSRGLKAIRFNPSTGLWAQPATTLAVLGASGGSHLSSVFDTSGQIAVAFRDLTANRPKYTMSSNASTWTAPLFVGSTGQGAGLSIGLSPTTSKPSVSYYDKTNNAVWVTSCSGTLTSCATSGWTPTQIDATAGVSGLATTAEQALSTAIRYDSSDKLSVVYSRGQGSTGSLMMYDTTTGSSNSYTLATDSNGTSAAAGSIPALSFGVAGWNVSGVRNASDGMSLVYVGTGNWLYSTSCKD